MAMKRPLVLRSLRLLLLTLTMLLLLNNCDSIGVDGGAILELGASLAGKQSITSKNGTFELGFFNLSKTNNWYIGIWYAQIPVKTIVWVANRDNPLTNMSGILHMSRDGHLRLYDVHGSLIWSTNNGIRAWRALILDSGNMRLFGGHNNSEIVWESFANPGDTWLPGMKMWKGMKLSSWKSSADPAPGPFSLSMDPSPGRTQYLLLYKNHLSYWSTGEWIVDHFANLPEMSADVMFDVVASFVKISPTRTYFTYIVKPESHGMMMLPRLVVDKNGELRAYLWIDNSKWSLIWSQPRDQCNVYDVCGAYGACNNNNIQFCSCLQGFTPKHSRAWNSQEWWSSGCIRRSPLRCSATNGTTDGFLEVRDKSLPSDQAVSIPEKLTHEQCHTVCLNNCTCTAFVTTNSTPPVCLLWFGQLLNLRDSSNGQTLFIRLAASDLTHLSSKKNGRVLGFSILLPMGAVFLTVSALLFAVFIRRRRRRLLEAGRQDDMPTSLRMFTYKELRIATKNFKHKLGSGAFGSVFKGTLPDSTLVAVKRLERTTHAEKQFRAETGTIGNIQHVNLVRLRGFCIERSQRLLVYEYMCNGSLNSFLFSKSEDKGAQKVLDWKTRFEIALGTARGLVYLHEECRDRIIHCDIKPENILLDEDFSAKLADFGLSKLVGRDFSKVLTTTRGTRGYLAPEWVYGLPITAKADVYSYGMTLLEIISGRRNLDLALQESSRYYFPSWAAMQIQKGNISGVVDGKITNNADIEEVRRATMVGVLCIQEDEHARPSMVQVVQMLEGTMQPWEPSVNVEQPEEEVSDSLV